MRVNRTYVVYAYERDVPVRMGSLKELGQWQNYIGMCDNSPNNKSRVNEANVPVRWFFLGSKGGQPWFDYGCYPTNLIILEEDDDIVLLFLSKIISGDIDGNSIRQLDCTSNQRSI